MTGEGWVPGEGLALGCDCAGVLALPNTKGVSHLAKSLNTIDQLKEITSMVFCSVMSQAAELNMLHPPGLLPSLVKLLVLLLGITVLLEVVGSPKQLSTSSPSLGPEIQPSHSWSSSQCLRRRQREGV